MAIDIDNILENILPVVQRAGMLYWQEFMSWLTSVTGIDLSQMGGTVALSTGALVALLLAIVLLRKFMGFLLSAAAALICLEIGRRLLL
ncbi:MAG: hypothetical protein IJ164_00220 [Duodenibacillus sp.]|nr:hypothetical protein [Duodenibacillus sp.]